MKRARLSTLILVGLVLGIAVGYCLNVLVPAGPGHKEVAGYLSMLAEIFLRLIKMILAPLVFAGIVTGMMGSEGPKEVGRLGLKAMVWFVTASVCSLVLGLVLANTYSLGSSMPLPQSGTYTDIGTGSLSLKTFVTHMVPQSAVNAMSQNEIIAIVVFAIFFGFALSSLRKLEPTAAVLAQSIEGVLKTMLRLTQYVMYFAPVGVFGATAAAIMEHGIGVIAIYGKFIGATYSGFAILFLLLVAAGYAFLRQDVFRLLSLMRTPFLIGFSTSSSEAAFPKTLEQLTKLGIPERITTLILPLGYSFNADGVMMYQAFATVFLLQAYHIHLSLVQQIGMLLVMLIASKGAAGVPRASLVVVASTLPMFGIPIEGLAILLAADTFIDMGRTVVNLTGNSIATAAIAKWELKRGHVSLTVPVEDSPLIASVNARGHSSNQT
ncbi:dicarboxylate/amino acid:cation symporter [Paraburkholderia sediminicola]|uniref:dicarboxylate/amino acid:cation symporter n=1 Tax=Paraburkholderia sediminicola TaxID=458836 RepID=UPI0038BBA9A3